MQPPLAVREDRPVPGPELSCAADECCPATAARLSAPGPDQHDSFLEALLEYHAEGVHLDLDPHRLREPASFAAWVDQVRHDGVTGSAQELRDRVPHRVLWWVCGPTYLGRVRIGLRLNDALRDFGGHIGYDVRPSARGRGHATALLAAALEVAASLGLHEVLLTCAPGNTASRRVIERNHGLLVDTSPRGRLRYWAPTTPN